MTSDAGQASSNSGRRYAQDGLSFGQTSLWTVLGTIIPGVGLIRAGRRVVGWTVLGITVLIGVGLGVFAVVKGRAIAELATNPTILYWLAAALLVAALVWVIVITASHLALRASGATAVHRLVGGLLVGVLSFAVAAPMALGANYAYTTATGIKAIFGDDDTGTPVNPDNPWADTPRLNILLLGGDSGVKSGRTLSVGARTDTVMVASIDTTTGATTLITLPRNTEHMAFPPGSPLRKYYPNGFSSPLANPTQYDRSQYLLNAMYRDVPAHVPNNILGKTKDFGAAVLMQSVGYVLGLDIEHYAFVNMDGFKDLINAIGGVTLNVSYYVPIGGYDASYGKPEKKPDGWISPGPNQHMSGATALWFARGRYHRDDYHRMERQRCVIQAVLDQTDPLTVLKNYQSVVDAGEKNITTNIPQSMLAPLAELALKIKGTKPRSLVFDPSTGFHSYAPDWDWVRDKVKKALNDTDTVASASVSASPAVSPSSSASASSSATPKSTAKGKSDDLESACAYDPSRYPKYQQKN